MKEKIFIFICLIILSCNLSCDAVKSTELGENVSNNSNAIKSESLSPTPSDDLDVTALCGRLNELKKIPLYPDEKNGDPIYDGLMEKGREAVPCLIEKITDTTPMPDPGSPAVQDYKVGDAAVFILLFITGEKWQPETMLSPEYAKHWKDDGIYAYYAYVEKPANRKKMQFWWKNWADKNLNK